MESVTKRVISSIAAIVLVAFALAVNVTAAPTTTSPVKDGNLRIWFIDVEGGQSTLFVTPEGQSLLIDTGWPANNGRDADRIVAAAKDAGLTRIDYVLITHFHMDHVGGVPQLVARIPVGTFIDHGELREHGPDTDGIYADYQNVLATGKFVHITPTPGDQLPIKGIKATVISEDAHLIMQPLPGAGQPNSYCAASETRPADQTENARSLGTVIEFGKLRILDLGDLTWDKEMQLMCPVNRIGHIDILIVSHHGWSQSSSPALVDAISPRVAIMDNGAKKGGSLPTLHTIRTIPGLEALWQLHYSEEGGKAENTAPGNIANLTDSPDTGYWLKLTAAPSGSFAVENSRTQQTTRYAAGK
jgi:beta-lactamase superfamily II metal-dependent hydrolase